MYIRGGAFAATKLYSGLSDHVSVRTAFCSARLGSARRAGFWSHRDDLYLRSACKKNVHHPAARGEKGRRRKRARWRTMPSRATSLAATFRCLFLLALAIHKATREVARNQQPSLSRWQIVERVRSHLSYVRAYGTRVAFPCADPSLFLPLSHSLIRASDFFFRPRTLQCVHNCRWVSRV